MTPEKKKYVKTRLISMLLDHFIMTFGIVIIILIIIGMVYLVMRFFLDSNFPEWLLNIAIFLGVVTFSVYPCKDLVQGKSPAKRILGLIVVDNKTEKIASPIQSVLRNVTLLLFPIEGIFLLFSPERRIGDYIAGTKIISDNKTLKTNFNLGQTVIALVIGMIIMSLFIALDFVI